MIKQSIRIAGFILALFALILVFKHTHMMHVECVVLMSRVEK